VPLKNTLNNEFARRRVFRATRLPLNYALNTKTSLASVLAEQQGFLTHAFDKQQGTKDAFGQCDDHSRRQQQFRTFARALNL
jgi:hypothetical protein